MGHFCRASISTQRNRILLSGVGINTHQLSVSVANRRLRNTQWTSVH